MSELHQPKATPASEERTSVPGRTLGVYPQKQDDRYMQRVRILGGRLNWHQWRKLAELAETYCGGFPLHLTTRQDVELHNIRGQDVAMVQQGLALAGLTVFGACGDSVRNVTVCAGGEFCAGGIDMMPLAQLVQHCIQQEPVIFTLPRKFKISFSGCPKACARPWVNDLGFIGQPQGRYRVIGAGSLGAKPALGIELYRDVPARDVLPLCIAAVEMFERHGDRHNRHRARFRHVREKLGDKAFQVELDARFKQVQACRSWPHITCAATMSDIRPQCRLQLPDGNITPTEVAQLADTAQEQEAAVRIDLEHGLVLYGRKPVPLPANLAALTTAPTIVACPGSRTCPRGLTDCWATAAKIRELLPTEKFSGVRINISGCPNGCAHSSVASIGLVGMVRTDKDGPTTCYRLFAGGGNGTDAVLASPRALLHGDKVPSAIRSLLQKTAGNRDSLRNTKT